MDEINKFDHEVEELGSNVNRTRVLSRNFVVVDGLEPEAKSFEA